MKKIVIVGAGNVGKAAAKAVLAAPDMELCGFIRRIAERVDGFENIPAVKNISELNQKPDGAIVALPSRFVESAEKELIENGIFTADAFDIHEKIIGMKERLSVLAKENGVSSIIGAGWDPGMDSSVRMLMFSAYPERKIYTNFGPGMSMGHSAAVREKPGVADAVSITLPIGEGKHKRKIYVVLDKKADKKAVEHDILSDEYFEHDECSVEFVDSLGQYKTRFHGVEIVQEEREEKLCFSLFADNPEFTGRILASSIRAAFLQAPGAYLIPEIPPSDFCPDGWEKFV